MLDQNAAVAAFLDEQDDCMRPCKAPMPSKHDVNQDSSPASKQEQKWFRSVLMSLSWFACQTRLDLSHTISQLAQQMGSKTVPDKPSVSAVQALKRVVSYVRYRPCFTLVVDRVDQDNEWGLYVDSDHAGDAPHNARSHTGVVLLLNGMPVQWRSNKQPVTALSSAAAEVYAFSEAVKDVNLNYYGEQRMSAYK